jgi:ribosomal protein S1
MPLGWLQVTFEPLDDAWIPELVASAPAEGTPPPVTKRLITAVDSAPTEGERPSAQPRTIDDLQEGQIVEGEVEGIAKFGAFVDIGLPFNGLIHISELSEEWVDRVEVVVHQGQKVRVRVIEVDVQRQRVGLSLKQV